MGITIDISKTARIDVCREVQEEILEKITYCIQNSSDLALHRDLIAIRQRIQTYVDNGDTATMVKLLDFINDCSGKLTKSADMLMIAKAAQKYNELTMLIKDIVIRSTDKPVTSAKIREIMLPAESISMSPQAFLDLADVLMKKLEKIKDAL